MPAVYNELFCAKDEELLKTDQVSPCLLCYPTAEQDRFEETKPFPAISRLDVILVLFPSLSMLMRKISDSVSVCKSQDEYYLYLCSPSIQVEIQEALRVHINQLAQYLFTRGE